MSGLYIYFMCVHHWHEVEHTVMLYVQMTACPSDSIQLLPNLVNHKNSVNPIVNTYLLILSSYHVTNHKSLKQDPKLCTS